MMLQARQKMQQEMVISLSVYAIHGLWCDRVMCLAMSAMAADAVKQSLASSGDSKPEKRD